MRRQITILAVLLAVIVCGCSGIHKETKNISIDNIMFFNGSVGLVFNTSGKQYLAIFNVTNDTPFLKSRIVATIYYRKDVPEKIVVNNTTYSVYQLFVRQGNNWTKIK